VLPATAVAPIVVEDPVQMVFAEPAAAVGKEFTVTVTELELTQPLELVSVTVYVVVVVGLTVGFADVELNPEGELAHEYVLPATAVAPIVVEDPVQIVFAEPAAATGNEFTVTVTEFELTQPLELVSVTVYVVVVVGLTVGLAEVELNPEGELAHE
jgi:hypothetical protein